MYLKLHPFDRTTLDASSFEKMLQPSHRHAIMADLILQKLTHPDLQCKGCSEKAHCMPLQGLTA